MSAVGAGWSVGLLACGVLKDLEKQMRPSLRQAGDVTVLALSLTGV
jgi:hypothetical protein